MFQQVRFSILNTDTKEISLNYTYLALLIPGFLLAVAGFVMLGKKLHPVITGLIFLTGIAALVLGVLLTCVPDFFSG